MKCINIVTNKHQTMIDITALVQETVTQCGIKDGLVLLFVPHTTAAVTLNENADPDVVTDILVGLEAIIPTKAAYKHREGNSHAHLKSSLVGVDQLVIVEEGIIQLGTWQGIYFCEFDGPRTRKLYVKEIGK